MEACGRDDILPRFEQPNDVIDEIGIGQGDARRVQHDIGVDRANFVDRIGGGDPGIGTPRKAARVLPRLAVAVDVDADELMVRRVEDTAKGRPPHRPRCPLNDPCH